MCHIAVCSLPSVCWIDVFGRGGVIFCSSVNQNHLFTDGWHKSYYNSIIPVDIITDLNVFLCLCARFRGQVGHCKILRREAGFGFADPYFIFPTLRDLVMHYHRTSLAEHNNELDVCLLYPVRSPAPPPPPPQPPRGVFLRLQQQQ